MKITISFLIAALITMFLFGCIERDLTFQIQYAELQDLKTGNLIYFQGNEIGQIEKISYRSQGDYLVDARIKYDFNNAATVNSKFYISDDPVIAENKAVVVEQQQAGGTVIQRGAIVQGSIKQGVLQNVFSDITQQIETAGNSITSNFEKLKESMIDTSREISVQLEEALGSVSKQFDGLNKEIRGIPDSEEVKKLEQSVKQLVDSLEKTSKDTHEQVTKQVIPALQNEIDQLRERLKQNGREEEINEVQKMIDEM